MCIFRDSKNQFPCLFGKTSLNQNMGIALLHFKAFVWIHKGMHMSVHVYDGCYSHAKGCWGYFDSREKIALNV